MRWPFFFGRASEARVARAPEPRAPIRDWASLPAIQRVVDAPQLTAPTADFVHSLAGTHDPDLSLEPLGHHVSLDAPAGLVSGIARVVDTYAPSAELVGRPRPRREPVAQRRIFSSEEPAGAASTVEDIEVADAPEPVTAAFTAIDAPVPVRPPLTRLSDVQAATILRTPTQRTPAEIAPVPVHEPAAGETTAAVAARPVTAQRLTLGQSRRLGLGAPIAKQAAATVQRSADTTPLDLAPPPRAPRAGEMATSSEQSEFLAAPGAQAEHDEPAAPATERIAPVAGATIQRRVTPHEDDVVPDARELQPVVDLPLAPAEKTRAVDPAPDPGRAVIQRVVATPLPPLFSRPASTLTAPLAPDRPGLLTVRRTFDSVEAGAPAAEPVTVQRIPAAGLPERVAPMPQLDVASARVPAPFREVVVAPAPAPRTMPPLVAPAPVAALAPLAPAVQRITPAAQDFVAYSQFAAPPATRLEQRATAVPDVPVQRETAGGEEPGGASAPVAAAGSGLAAAEAPGHSDKDLDDLARKLYDRVSLNLRRDLLIQRERAGLVHDWR